MHRSMSNKSTGNEKIDWKHRVYAAGHDLVGRAGSVGYPRIFLTLIAIHTSIFIIPQEPSASIILLLALIKGWMNGL